MTMTVWPKCCLIWEVCGPWESPYGANGQITMTLYNYRSRQVHKILNGVNPSSGFRDMRSAKSGPDLWEFWQVFGPWASPYGANGQMTMTVHNYKPRRFHRNTNGENPSSGYRDMGSASLAAARQAARSIRDNTPPARVTDGQADRQTDRRKCVLRAAWSQLKKCLSQDGDPSHPYIIFVAEPGLMERKWTLRT